MKFNGSFQNLNFPDNYFIRDFPFCRLHARVVLEFGAVLERPDHIEGASEESQCFNVNSWKPWEGLVWDFFENFQVQFWQNLRFSGYSEATNESCVICCCGLA